MSDAGSFSRYHVDVTTFNVTLFSLPVRIYDANGKESPMRKTTTAQSDDGVLLPEPHAGVQQQLIVLTAATNDFVFTLGMCERSRGAREGRQASCYGRCRHKQQFAGVNPKTLRSECKCLITH